MRGLDVPGGVYTHIVGSDLVRDRAGRSSSSRTTCARVRRVVCGRKPACPEARLAGPVRQLRSPPGRRYAQELLEVLRSVAPPTAEDPSVVVLTPGVYNSAFFEHAFLAKAMGVELVQGRDLFVDDGSVFMRTTKGQQRVDVIYRRVDETSGSARLPPRFDARRTRPLAATAWVG